MEWLNIHTSVLDSPEFVLSGDGDRSTWLCLLRFCAGQENGGIIADAAGWSDRQWQQLARVSKRNVRSKNATLWKWEGNDIHVFRYPVEKERDVQKNRENGSKGGRPPKNQPDNPPDNPPVYGAVNPPETTRFDFAETEGKGREGNGRERKEKGREGVPETPATETKRLNPARPADVLEVSSYFLSQMAPAVEAEKFFDYYTANGWRVGGRAKMNDWRAAARRWIRNWRNPPEGGPGGYGAPRQPSAPFDPDKPAAHTGGIPEAGETPPATPSASQTDSDNQKPSENP